MTTHTRPSMASGLQLLFSELAKLIWNRRRDFVRSLLESLTE
jgi:hypothetical protein